MVEPSLRFNYVVVLYIIFDLQKENPENPYIPKPLILQKLSKIPEEKRKFLNFNWKSEGFNQVIHRLEKLKLIESKVIVKKRLLKMLKLNVKGKKMVDYSYDVVKIFMDF